MAFLDITPLAIPSVYLPASLGVLYVVPQQETNGIVIAMLRLYSSDAAQTWDLYLTRVGGGDFKIGHGVLNADERQIELTDGELLPLRPGDALKGHATTAGKVSLTIGAFRGKP